VSDYTPETPPDLDYLRQARRRTEQLVREAEILVRDLQQRSEQLRGVIDGIARETRDSG
jgi:hypothetical protein